MDIAYVHRPDPDFPSRALQIGRGIDGYPVWTNLQGNVEGLFGQHGQGKRPDGELSFQGLLLA